MNTAFCAQIMELLPPGPPNPLTGSHEGDTRTRSGVMQERSMLWRWVRSQRSEMIRNDLRFTEIRNDSKVWAGLPERLTDHHQGYGMLHCEAWLTNGDPCPSVAGVWIPAALLTLEDRQEGVHRKVSCVMLFSFVPSFSVTLFSTVLWRQTALEDLLSIPWVASSSRGSILILTNVYSFLL